MASQDETWRPSFKSFWRKGKEKPDAAPSINSTTSSPLSTQDNDSNTTAPAAAAAAASKSLAQSQARRAQVRSAQIRHRKRKANYVSELEAEISEYRTLIAEAQQVASALRGENEGFKRRLTAAGVLYVGGAIEKQEQQQEQQQQQEVEGGGTPELFGDVDINELTVTLAMEDAMGTPAFHISSSSSDSSPQSSGSFYNHDGDMILTVAQEETAINFILALEHICWRHYHPSDSFTYRVFQTVTAHGSGHTLMASSYCMDAAPHSVYKDRKSLPTASDPPTCPSTVAAGSSPASSTPTPSSHIHTAPSPLSPSASSTTTSLQWPSPRISLEKLRGLASSLNPGDLELTPVQAWFELADRYPPALLLDGGASTALEALKRELRGMVKCLHYGAVVEREAFESVVSRVMGQFIGFGQGEEAFLEDTAMWDHQQLGGTL